MEKLQSSKGYIKLDINKKETINDKINKKIEAFANKQDLSDLTTEDLEQDTIIFPSVLYKTLETFVNKFDNMSPEEIDKLPNDTKMLLLKLGESLSLVDGPSTNYLYKKDITKKPLVNPNVVNEIKYNDKNYGILHPTINKITNENSFLMELQEGVGLGKLTKIILWNSGFWITIRPPQNEDLVNLYTKLTQEIEYVAEETTLFGFSNISTIFYKVAWDYILDHLVDSSLDVNPKHLSKYISILDMDTILLGILSQIFYNGFNTTLLCKNNYKLDENNNPKCNFTYDVNLDLTKLLWVDTGKLDTEMLTIISKRGPRTQTINEIKQYQKKLQPIDNKILVTLNNNKVLEITLTIPNLKDSLDNSELYLLELKKSINNFLSTVTNKDEFNENKARFLQIVSKNLFLGIYSLYIKELRLEEFKTDKKSTIFQALKTLSNNTKDVNNIIDKIENYLTNTTITTIAIPDFICPTCGASQSDEPIFENLVPVNMVNYFFTLSKLLFMKSLLEKTEIK